MAVLLVVAVVLVPVASVLAAAETALSRITRTRAEALTEQRRPGASALVVLLRDRARVVAVLSLLRTVVELTLAVCVALAVAAVAPWWVALLVGGVGLGLVSFVAVAVVPRALGRSKDEAVATVVAPLLRAVDPVLGPLVQLVVRATDAVLPGKGAAAAPFTTEAELLELVEQAEASSVIDSDESLMLQRVVHLRDTVARAVMVPRTEMVSVDAETPIAKAVALHLRSGFSRIPVEGRNADDIVGVSYLKDLVRRLPGVTVASTALPGGGSGAPAGREPGEGLAVADAMRPVAFVPESKPADDLLREMQRESRHLAVVIDEYGGVAGIVTIEDLIEEIVGQISDEYDRETPEAETLGPEAWRLNARAHLHALAEVTGVEIEDDEVDTVAGLLAKHLGRVPLPGSSVEVSGLRITAERLGGRRHRLASVLAEVVAPVEPLVEVTAGENGESSRRRDENGARGSRD